MTAGVAVWVAALISLSFPHVFHFSSASALLLLLFFISIFRPCIASA
jgi:hypothetical protein